MMASPVARKRFICPDCAAEFSRKDHAKRHKLSHEQPSFACPYANCGLLFHRRDVLRRHEAVHKPENAEKRRRPRRGPLPPALPRSEERRWSSPAPEAHEARADRFDHQGGRGAELAGSSDEDPIDYACSCQVGNGTVCGTCSAELIRLAKGRISPEWEGAIKFCMTHYIQSQLKWFPFIRPSSLRTDWFQSGRAFLLAALGARGIKEYKILSGELWVEAVKRIGDRVSSPTPGPGILSEFQTKILLVEYLQWSEDNQRPAWVSPMLNEMTHRESHNLMDMLVDLSYENTTNMSVEDELRQEELRWTLWKFYCIMTRAILLGVRLHPPRLFQTLDLPGDPDHLLALSQCAGTTSDRLARSTRSEYRSPGLTLPQVLSVLLADDHRRASLPDMLSIISKDIVLHAILYLADNMVEDSEGAKIAKQEVPGWQVETRGRLHLLVTRWRQCFWVPPEVLWSTSFPEFGRLQSIMFVIYLAVRLSQPARDPAGGKLARDSRQHYVQCAMRSIVTMHINMKNNDLIEVAAKGRWFLDGATWRSGGLTSKFAMDWFHSRTRYSLGDEDIDFLQSLESVMALYSYAGSYDGASYSPARLAQLERSVQHLWTTILGTDVWLDNEFERPGLGSYS